MADLEALLGHAVALESRDDMAGPWRSPELAAAALCVPVSSPTVPLGTLWFFSSRERKFTDDQTNIAEVVAGKIASDLERTVLLQEQAVHKRSSEKTLQKQVAKARESQGVQLPVAPPLHGWSVGGWAEQAGELGGAFYDWRMLSDSSLLAMLGDACDGGVEAALASTALRSVLRAVDLSGYELGELLQQVNQSLWEISAGGWWGGLWLGKIDLAKGRCDFTTAGRPAVWWLRSDGWTSLAKPTEPLGLEPQITQKPQRVLLAPGQSLVVCNRGMIDATDENGRPLDQSAIAQSLIQQGLSQSPQAPLAEEATNTKRGKGKSALAKPGLSTDKMIDLIRHEFDSRSKATLHADRALLLIQRLLG
jgi:serine phosphatase RsbU (regulator of sigma subunit)